MKKIAISVLLSLVICTPALARDKRTPPIFPPPLATQAEAEAGTSTSARSWTPLLVKQAIAALVGTTLGGVKLDDSTPDAAGEVSFVTDKYTFYGANSESIYFRPGSTADNVIFGSDTGAVMWTFSGITAGFSSVVVGTTDLGTPALNATATLASQVGKITIANNCIIDLTSWPASGSEGKKTLYMTNPGAATITWKTGGSALTPKYVGGSAPTWTALGLDVVVLTSIDGGTTVYLFVVGQDVK